MLLLLIGVLDTASAQIKRVKKGEVLLSGLTYGEGTGAIVGASIGLLADGQK